MILPLASGTLPLWTRANRAKNGAMTNSAARLKIKLLPLLTVTKSEPTNMTKSA